MKKKGTSTFIPSEALPSTLDILWPTSDEVHWLDGVENTGEVEDRGAHSAYPLLQRALCEDGGIHVLIP